MSPCKFSPAQKGQTQRERLKLRVFKLKHVSAKGGIQAKNGQRLQYIYTNNQRKQTETETKH